jgi:exodeoxyribonuclease V alpha subunit
MSGTTERLLPKVDELSISPRFLATMETIIRWAVSADRIDSISDAVWIAGVRALHAHEEGHTCISLEGEPKTVKELKALDSLVSTGASVVPGARHPFVLEGSDLYVARAFDEESSIAADIVRTMSEGRLKVILGGPGTGKTTRVAALLVKRFTDPTIDPDLTVLAAPTGKAADRMRKAIEVALDRGDEKGTPYPADVKERVRAVRAVTVHRLLGYAPAPRPPRKKFRHCSENPLPHDLVIIDETSMMPMSLMYRVLRALRPDTTDRHGAELILVGDPDQLASVESGSVLGDLRSAAVPGSALGSVTEKLEVQYRFKAESPIGVLISTIKQGDSARVLEILQAHRGGESHELEFIDPEHDLEAYARLADEVRNHAISLRDAARRGDDTGALALKSMLQVLCAHRQGRSGVGNWNHTVNEWIGERGRQPWFAGRPVLVTRNDYVNEVFNGDVGVVVEGANQKLVVAFPGADGSLFIAPERLGNLETVHALTIHKSQGSEYDHAIVILPHGGSRLLTRELLYTGASRAKKRLTIVGSPAVVATAVETTVARATRLDRRLGR